MSKSIDCPAGCGEELNETITEVYAHLVLECPDADKTDDKYVWAYENAN